MSNDEISYSDLAAKLGFKPQLCSKIMQVFAPHEEDGPMRLWLGYLHFIDAIDTELNELNYVTQPNMLAQIAQAINRKPFIHELLEQLVDGFVPLIDSQDANEPQREQLAEPLHKLARLMNVQLASEIQSHSEAVEPVATVVAAADDEQPQTTPTDDPPLFGAGHMPSHMVYRLNQHMMFFNEGMTSFHRLDLQDTEPCFKEITIMALRDFGYGAHDVDSLDWQAVYRNPALHIAAERVVMTYAARSFHQLTKDLTASELDQLPAIAPIALLSAETAITELAAAFHVEQSSSPKPLIDAIAYAATLHHPKSPKR